MNRGFVEAIIAYTLWGILPIFWKTMTDIPSQEILAHRILWSFILLIVILGLRRQWSWIKESLFTKKVFFTYLGSSVLIGGNWFVYIWAVNSGHIVESSLGYFINPLVSVFLGVLFLKEKLRSWQWVSIITATLGVTFLTIRFGAVPWIALSLAFTFGFYGLIRKTAPLGSITGLATETAFLVVPVLAYLIYLEIHSIGSFGHVGLGKSSLLSSAGIATAVPLLFFAAAIKKVRLSTMGLIQYLAPTLQLMVGVLIFNENFSKDRIIGFSIIWLALIIYSVEGLITHRSNSRLRNSLPA